MLFAQAFCMLTWPWQDTSITKHAIYKSVKILRAFTLKMRPGGPIGSQQGRLWRAYDRKVAQDGFKFQVKTHRILTLLSKACCMSIWDAILALARCSNLHLDAILCLNAVILLS